MSVLTDLAQRLVDANVGTLGTDLFLGRRPDQPNQCLTLTTYPGDASRIRDDEYLPADERYNVQVMARAASFPDAETLANSAWKSVQFRHETLASGRRYSHCRAPQMPAFIGVDENDRPLIAFNLEIRRDGDLA